MGIINQNSPRLDPFWHLSHLTDVAQHFFIIIIIYTSPQVNLMLYRELEWQDPTLRCLQSKIDVHRERWQQTANGGVD